MSTNVDVFSASDINPKINSELDGVAVNEVQNEELILVISQIADGFGKSFTNIFIGNILDTSGKVKIFHVHVVQKNSSGFTTSKSSFVRACVTNTDAEHKKTAFRIMVDSIQNQDDFIASITTITQYAFHASDELLCTYFKLLAQKVLQLRENGIEITI